MNPRPAVVDESSTPPPDDGGLRLVVILTLLAFAAMALLSFLWNAIEKVQSAHA